MNRKTVFIVVIIFIMMLSAIGYGVYINISSSTHLKEMHKIAGANLTFTAAQRRDIIPVIRAALTFEAGWKRDIYAKADGQLEHIMVKQGDQIAAGTLVAVIENRELDGQIKQARGNVYSAKANLEQAESDVKKCELLMADDAVAEVMLTASRYKREMARGQLISSEGALEQLLVKSENNNVFAAHAGVVIKQYVHEGEFAKVSLPIISIGEITTLKAIMPLDRLYREVMPQGAVVGIQISGIDGGEFSGTIKSVIVSPGLPPGSMMAEIIIDNANQLLQPGAYSQAEISAPKVKNALVVPDQAVFVRDGRQLVYVVGSDKHVRLRAIRTGYSKEGWTIVHEGLADGEKVVAHGQDGLTDGMMIDMGAMSHE